MGGRAGGGARGGGGSFNAASIGAGLTGWDRIDALDKERTKFMGQIETLSAKAYSKAYNKLEVKASNGSGQVIYSPSPAEVRPLAGKILSSSKTYQSLKQKVNAIDKEDNKVRKSMRKKK